MAFVVWPLDDSGWLVVLVGRGRGAGRGPGRRGPARSRAGPSRPGRGRCGDRRCPAPPERGLLRGGRRPHCPRRRRAAGTLRPVPFLSPAKLLVILVVALIVLGPDKLPKVAKQIGGLWGDFRRFRERLESDVRGTFPDLPSTETITQAVRSPLSSSTTWPTPTAPRTGPHPRRAPAPNHLMCRATPCSPRRSPTGRPGSVQAVEEPPAIPEVLIVDPGGIVHQVRSNGRAIPDDPGMN